MSKPDTKNPANLLDMLRQSSASVPAVPVIQTPPPKPAKPQSALGNDLLNALRSSVSQPVDKMDEVNPKSQQPVGDSQNKTPDKLASILSASKRTRPVTEKNSHSPAPEVSADSPSRDTANKL